MNQDNFDYSNSYWKSCQYRFKYRTGKLKNECNLQNNMKILKYTDGTNIAYYLLHDEKLIGSLSGYMVNDNNETAFYISISIVNPEHHNKGYGSILYNFVINKYKILYSDHDLSPYAEHMWNKIKKQYKNVKYNESRYCVRI